MRSERLRTWALFPLRYTEQHDTDVETYELAGDGTTLAQEQFQREWNDFLRSGPDVPIIRPLDEGETRLGRVWEWLRAVPRDLLYAVRVLGRSPSFALTSILTLGLGLGLNAAFFTVFHAFVLKPVAVRDPGSLVEWTFRTRDNHPTALPLRDFAIMRSSVRAFSDSAATAAYVTSLDGHPARAALVTDNYFTLLGVSAARGRTLEEGESEPVLVLSHRTCQRSFGENPAIVGSKLRVHGVPFEVIGVASPEFEGHNSGRTDFWAPIQVWDRMPNLPHDYDLAFVGRMRSGVWEDRAEAILTGYVRRLGAEHADYRHLFRAEVETLSIPIPWAVFRYFVPLLVAMALTMAIPCANAANMMLARAMARQRELGVRLSLGASRGRVVRQLLTEGMVIALIGGSAGLLLARSALGFFERLFYSTAPPTILFRFRVPKVELDITVYFYMLIVAALTTIAFALAPSAQATKAAVSAVLRGDFSVWRISRMRDALVVGQVAVCAGLLILTGSLLRGTHRIATIERGYDPYNVYAAIGQDHENARTLHQALVRQPWVESAAFMASPFTAMNTLQVGDAAKSGYQTAYYNRGSEDFFRLMRIPLVRGRTFTREEASAHAPVVVVSETAARQLWPGQEPLGKTLSIEPRTRRYEWGPPFDSAEVIGICRDVVKTAADREPRASVYFPNAAARGMVVAVRGRGTPEQTVRSMEELLAGTAGGLQGARVASLQETLDWESYPYLAASWLSSILGALALLLTITGIYSVMSYLVSQRTKEIGVRMALGATRTQVVKYVVRYTAKLAAPGLVLGVVLAVGAAKYFVASFGTTIEADDVISYMAGLLVVSVSSLVAVAGPARRAAGIDPMGTLRAE
jgi:predicted permease